MKAAISIPDHICREAERHARRVGKSRSELYADALAEYLARHAPYSVTEAVDAVCGRLDQAEDERLVPVLAKRMLKRESW
jgi:metal-responsive CopG/Arc/MetJ family transcriptional regulator